MPETFGPYKWTPEIIAGEIIKGRQVGPSAFDFEGIGQQYLDFEEIRKMLIDRILREKYQQEQRPYPVEWNKYGELV